MQSASLLFFLNGLKMYEDDWYIKVGAQLQPFSFAYLSHYVVIFFKEVT